MAVEKKLSIEADLTAMDRCDLNQAWPIIRGELEKALSDSVLVCVPSYNDAELYDNSCVFVQSPAKTYVPLGKLQDLIDKSCSTTDKFWHNLYDRTTIMKDDGIPPDFDLELKDEEHRRKIELKGLKLQRRSLRNLRPNTRPVTFNASIKPELAHVDTIHVVQDVVGANELCVTASDEVNVDLFSIVSWKPILIGFKTYQLNNEFRIIKEITDVQNIYNSVREAWSNP